MSLRVFKIFEKSPESHTPQRVAAPIVSEFDSNWTALAFMSGPIAKIACEHRDIVNGVIVRY